MQGEVLGKGPLLHHLEHASTCHPVTCHRQVLLALPTCQAGLGFSPAAIATAIATANDSLLQREAAGPWHTTLSAVSHGSCCAGMAYKGSAFGADEAQTTLATNFLGTKAVCEALLPLMSTGSRIVNVSST